MMIFLKFFKKNCFQLNRVQVSLQSQRIGRPSSAKVKQRGPREKNGAIGPSIVVGGPPVGVPVRPRTYAHPDVQNFLFKV